MQFKNKNKYKSQESKTHKQRNTFHLYCLQHFTRPYTIRHLVLTTHFYSFRRERDCVLFLACCRHQRGRKFGCKNFKPLKAHTHPHTHTHTHIHKCANCLRSLSFSLLKPMMLLRNSLKVSLIDAAQRPHCVTRMSTVCLSACVYALHIQTGTPALVFFCMHAVLKIRWILEKAQCRKHLSLSVYVIPHLLCFAVPAKGRVCAQFKVLEGLLAYSSSSSWTQCTCWG